MPLTIPQALAAIKHKIHDYVPDTLLDALADEVHLCQRRRTLPAAVTTHLFLRQVLHGNTACSHLRHLADLDFTDAAYCKARGRLPLSFFRRLQHAVTGRLRYAQPQPDPYWVGHRVFLLDGSSFSMPDTDDLQQAFGQPGGQRPGCGFPTAHLLALFDYRTGFLLKALPAPLRTHDLAQAAWMHPELRPGDVLVADRAFCSYAHLALCHRRGIQAVFRAHQKQIVDFRPGRPYAGPGATGSVAKGLPRSRWVKRLGENDQLVEYFKPKDRPGWMTAAAYDALPASVVVREVRFRVRVPGRRVREVTVVTTLTDPRRYSARRLARLYGCRWQVEVDLRHLKQTLGMDVLKCRTLPGVVKEMLVFVTVYNLVRRVMVEASRRQQVVVHRISFVDALRWLREAGPGDEVGRLKVNPKRPGRYEPRVRKRRPKQYPVMTKPRDQLRQALVQQPPAA